MMKLPRVLHLRNRRSCNIVVPNRRPLFPNFLAPRALNGANTVVNGCMPIHIIKEVKMIFISVILSPTMYYGGFREGLHSLWVHSVITLTPGIVFALNVALKTEIILIYSAFKYYETTFNITKTSYIILTP